MVEVLVAVNELPLLTGTSLRCIPAGKHVVGQRDFGFPSEREIWGVSCVTLAEGIRGRAVAQQERYSEPPPRWAVGRFGRTATRLLEPPGLPDGGR